MWRLVPGGGSLLLHIRGPSDGLGRGSGVRGAAEESRQAGADCDSLDLDTIRTVPLCY